VEPELIANAISIGVDCGAGALSVTVNL
jgi:hypothetical protein